MTATTYFDMMMTVAALPCVYEMYFKNAPPIKPRRFSQDCVERAFADLRRSNANFRALDARPHSSASVNYKHRKLLGVKKATASASLK